MSITSDRTSADMPGPIQRSIQELGPWFHNLHLPDGTQTAPGHPYGDFPAYKWKLLAPELPKDLRGWRALDVGCNAGFYSFELAKRGAHVTGIDVDQHYLAQAWWACHQFGFEDRVEFKQMQVYDLARCSDAFDLVLFMGVFYHLRYPMLGLDIVSQRVRRLMVFQTLMMPGEEVYENTWDRGMNDRDSLLEPGWPKMAFIEHRFAGDLTNWWIASNSGVQAMLRSAGMRITGRPDPEIYLCEPDPSRPSCMTTWNRAEFLSATGQPWWE